MDEHLDLNLLVTLDALLERGSVKEAAAELGRSMPAVSRSLSRIRAAFDDPILVRSGQRLVPTPLALEIQSKVHELLNDATALMNAKEDVDPALVSTGFVIAMTDPLMCSIGTVLIRFLEKNAPGIKVSFVVEGPTPLAINGAEVDLEVGVIVSRRAEQHVEDLFEDRLVGIARADHPIFDAPITFDRYVAFKHLLHSRRGAFSTPIDEQLRLVGRTRTVAASAPTLAASLFILTHTDLVGTCLESTTRPMAAELGLRYFDLPLKRRSSSISLVWHRRFDNDAVHRWLRDHIREFVLSLNEFSEHHDFRRTDRWDGSLRGAAATGHGEPTAEDGWSGPPREDREAARSFGP